MTDRFDEGYLRCREDAAKVCKARIQQYTEDVTKEHERGDHIAGRWLEAMADGAEECVNLISSLSPPEPVRTHAITERDERDARNYRKARDIVVSTDAECIPVENDEFFRASFVRSLFPDYSTAERRELRSKQGWRIGQRVRLTAYGEKKLLGVLCGSRKGIVDGFGYNEDHIRVRVDGCASASTFHNDFWEADLEDVYKSKE